MFGAEYCVVLNVQDFDLLTVEHGVAVDRNACVFCHVGIYKHGAFVIDQVFFAPRLPSPVACADTQRINLGDRRALTVRWLQTSVLSCLMCNSGWGSAE